MLSDQPPGASMSHNGPRTDQRSQTRGFLFSDLRGYSAFTERYGDAAARDLLRRYRTSVREVIGRIGGAEIRTEGDSFYVVFSSVAEAVQSGLAILEAATAPHPDGHQIHVGIGVHAGETVDSAEGIVSSAVNTAARLCSVAGAGELLVSDTVRALTRTHLDVNFVPLGRRRLKGIAEPVTIYRVHPIGSRQPTRMRFMTLAGRLRDRAKIAAGLVLIVLISTVIGAALLREGLGGARPRASGSAPPTGSGSVAGTQPSGASASPPAGVIAFVRTTIEEIELQQIFTIRSDGTGEVQLTRADSGAFNFGQGFPAWHPDGEQLAFNQGVEIVGEQDMAYEVFTMNRDGSAMRQITHSDQFLLRPVWSPDGSAVVVTVTDPATGLGGEIAIVDIRTGEVRPVAVQAEGNARDPSWSADGSQLLVVVDTYELESGAVEGHMVPSDSQLWVVDSETGSGRAIFTLEADNGALLAPVWSPAGDQIAFAIEESPNTDVYVANTEGTGFRQLTDHPAIDTEPGWSPDGSWIVFVSDRDFHPELYVMTSEGTSVTRLTETEANVQHSTPVWGPP